MTTFTATLVGGFIVRDGECRPMTEEEMEQARMDGLRRTPVPQLRTLARWLGRRGYSRLRKADLIKLIVEG